MTIVNHTLSILVSPGKVLRNWEKNNEIEKDNNDSIGKKEEFYCKFCAMKRPERAHHCKICGMCVLKMDHHCPWIANCVGFNNQKYFYLFLFYSVLGCLIISISLGTKINFDPNTNNINNINNNTLNFTKNHSIINNTIKNDKFKNSKDADLNSILAYFEEPLLIICGCGLSGLMSFCIGILFVYQTILILNNFTSIENQIYKTAHFTQKINVSIYLQFLVLIKDFGSFLLKAKLIVDILP